MSSKILQTSSELKKPLFERGQKFARIILETIIFIGKEVSA
jgi:hypothetical protein